jgi:hypothetical protein
MPPKTVSLRHPASGLAGKKGTIRAGWAFSKVGEDCYEAPEHILISEAGGAYVHILESIDENCAFVDCY